MADTKKQTLITLDELPQLLRSLSCRNILLLADPVAYDVNNLPMRFAPLFEKAAVRKIDVAAKLLTVESLEKTCDECVDFHPDIIIMIGGGTVLDTGKMINILFSYTCKASDLVGFKSTGRTFIPMVALPTTAGTGSECTHFAVLYRDMVKYSVADPGLVPDYVILAPELTLSMPKMLAVHTGFDALAQAIESYWSINATDESKGYAREALSLIRQRFTVSVQQADFQSRSAMQKAAFLSGKAINIAQTTAAHAVSYPMSSFFGIPHGLAVFLTLPSIYAFNGGVSDADCTDPRGVAYVQQVMAELGEMIGGNDTTGAAEILRSYLNAFSIDSRLSAYGIADEQAINRILDHGFNPQRMKNNPRRITRQDLSALLREIL